MTAAEGGSCPPGPAAREQAALEAAGWVRRTVTDRPRVGELVRTYRELGFDTTVVEIDPAGVGGACRSCVLSTGHACVTLFTRRTGARPAESPRR